VKRGSPRAPCLRISAAPDSSRNAARAVAIRSGCAAASDIFVRPRCAPRKGDEGVDGVVPVKLGFFERQQIGFLDEDLDATGETGQGNLRNEDAVELFNQHGLG
jgi:hypothetical protein